jgi:beta-glucanase (GH16 family)
MKNKIGAIALGILLIAIVIFGLGYRPGSTKTPTKVTKTIQHIGPPNVTDSKKWVQVFSDDFNGNTLDTNKWITCYDAQNTSNNGCTNAGNQEQEWYLPQQVSVTGGAAVLTATNQPVTIKTSNGPVTYPYRSGMISTGRSDVNGKVKWSANYGYYEARMKIDGGQGVWPAFWLLPADKSWPPEIDIMEALGNQSHQVLLTSHWGSASDQSKDSSTITGPDFTNGWHTYAVNWQPNEIDWYIDGELKKTVTGQAVPNKPMEIIIDLAIGGQLPGNANATTPFPRTTSIDYVHVFEEIL